MTVKNGGKIGTALKLAGTWNGAKNGQKIGIVLTYGGKNEYGQNKWREMATQYTQINAGIKSVSLGYSQ